jgi:hypothetical protein
MEAPPGSSFDVAQARIIRARRETSDTCVIEGRARKREGIGTNCCNAVLVLASTFVFLHGVYEPNSGRLAAPSHRPVAFALESLPLDAITVNNLG